MTAIAPRAAPERVAILLLALGNPLGTKLMQSFEPTDVKKIMESAASLGPIERGDLEGLVDDFAAQFARTLGLETGFEHVRSLVEQAFTPDQIDTMLGPARITPEDPVWRAFGEGSENALTPYLLDEHPQTIAYILCQLDPDLAARVLALLPRDARDGTARRLLKIQPVQPDVSAIVQQALREDLLNRSDAGLEDEGRRRVASLMNKLDREQAAAIVESLAATRPEEAKRLRGMIFSFDDLDRLTQSARLSLFDKIDTGQVVQALRGASLTLKESVLSALGARARRMVEAELANDTGAVTPDVHKARRAIAEAALAMAQRGEINLPSDAEG
ncbi:FliG C-terminal domain-containing protein [Aestuariivirga sp.]|uniref:FliG C-terminal domain-containing protein n=1 Tax=Aestuariivirga sp. TaxID=2650926 RepID=UPI0039E6A2D8